MTLRTSESGPSPEPSRDGRRDAFAKAILGEKDPVVRGILENFRGQIATIAANHGANARDVWDPAVQARMSVDEMERVNALFKMIVAFSERKLTAAQSREIGEMADEREWEAKELIEKAFGSFPRNKEVVERISEMYLREGFTEEAWKFFLGLGINPGIVDSAFMVRLNLARAKSIREEDPKMSIVLLRNAQRDIQRNLKTFRDDGALFLEAYDAYCSSLDDAWLDSELTQLSGEMNAPFAALAVECLAIEFDHRGLGAGSVEIVGLRSAIEADRHAKISDERSVEQNLLLAEMCARSGRKPDLFMDRAVHGIRERLGFMDDSEKPNARKIIGFVARTAVRLGDMNVCEEMQNHAASIPTDVWDQIAEGYIDAGNLDKAIETLETKVVASWDKDVVREKIVRAAIQVGDFVRAERVAANGPEDDDLLDEIRLGRIVARARKGERVIEDARSLAWGFDGDPNHSNGDAEVALSSVAIASLAFAREVRKRVGKRD